VSEAIYGAMVQTASMPLHDKLPMKLSIQYKLPWPEVHRRFILIQIAWVDGGSIAVKKKFYKRIADEISEWIGVRKEDVWINLVDYAQGRLVFRQR
jgi:hypothetical protein